MLGLGPSRGAGDDLHRSARQPGSRDGPAEVGPHVRRESPRQAEPAGHVAAGRQQRRPEPPVDAEGADRRRVAAGSAEPVGKVEDAPGLGSAEGVDRLVRITEGHDVAAVAGDRVHQADLGRVGVLVLVDEHRGDLRPQDADDVRLGEQDPAAVHELGVVQHALGVQDVEILVEEGADADPLRASGGLAGGHQVVGVHPELPGAGQHRSDLGGERAGREGAAQRVRPLGAPRLQAAEQCLPDPELLLRSGEQPDLGAVSRRLWLHPVGKPSDQRVAEGVEGHRHRRDRGPAQPGGDPRPQVGGGAAGEGQHQDLVRARPTAVDPVHHRLDQRGGLAGARPGEHQQRAARVLHHGLLGRVQLWCRRNRHGTSNQAVHAAIGPPAADIRPRPTRRSPE